MRVLVTGGAGYVGSHTIHHLARLGFDCTVFDNLSTGFRYLAGSLPFIEGDIRNYEQIRNAVEGAEAVVHFAAHAYVGESVRDPRKYYDNNVRGTLTLLDAAVDAGVKKFVFSSTCAIYGIPPAIPIEEKWPTRPINPYGETKLAIERALEAYDRAYNLRFVALRYFNAAGADESGDIGEMHDPETHLIPLLLRSASGGEEVTLFGSDYDTADGTCVRDYIHVNDLADAHARALKHLTAMESSEILNLGTGTGYSVKDIVSAVERITGQKVRFTWGPRRSGDPPVLIASGKKAQAILGWRPQRALSEIIETAWQWEQARPDISVTK